MEELTALVIDNGTSTIKAGFAGDDAPRALFPTIVGKPIKSKTKNIKDCTDTYIGYDIDTINDSLITSNPIEEGYVKNWDDMEKIWEYTLVSQLCAAPEEHPILLTEAPLNPIKLREAATQVMFEVFNIPSFYLNNQCIAALYASGRTSGLVLESGEEITNMTSIYEGYTLPHSSERLPLAGNDITRYLINILKERSIDLSGIKEFTIAKDIKEKLCYIAEDFNTALNESTQNYLYKKLCELPDGRSIKIGNERFRSPEILFQPELVGKSIKGIHNCLLDSILKCDIDIRRDMFNSILLAGGSTMFPGINERICLELNKLAPSSYKVNVICPEERKYSTWIGCSILASLTSFESMWITKAEYEESGPRIVQRKCF